MSSQLPSVSNSPSNPSPEVFLHQAETCYLQGDYDQAIAACQKALELKPNWPPVYVTMGNVSQGRGQIQEAIRYYAKALEFDPNLPQAHANLGSMFYKQGQLESAIASYQKAIALKPDLTAVYVNLARALRQLGRESEALIVEQKAHQINSSTGGAIHLYNQGNQLVNEGKLEEAIALWKQAIVADPNLAEAYCQIGIIHRHQGQPKEAIPFLEKAIELKPNFIAAHQNICGIYRDSSDLASARNAVESYLKNCGSIDPIMTAIYAVSIYQVSGLNAVALKRFLQLESQVPALLAHTKPVEIKSLYANLLFALPYLRDDLEKNYKLQRLISDRYVSLISPTSTPTTIQTTKGFGNIPSPKTVKIGILSKNFCRHSVGWCSADVIKELAALNTEIYLYWSDRPTRDNQTPAFEQVAHKVFAPQNFPQGLPNPQEIVNAIRQDQIDILLDLDSLSVQINTEILAHQPARFCISWLGFDSPQISADNYFIGDHYTHPPGRESYYTEKLIRMPQTFMAVSGFKRVSADQNLLRQAYRISRDQVVYLCVAPGRKFNPDLVKAQVNILKQVPDSILVHKALGDTQIIRETYAAACQAIGVGQHRIKQISRFATEEEHRKIYMLADVLLDSYPYNGGTHSLEALWFNTPLVTRRGSQFLSRMGYSFLKGVGVEMGIADSWEDYQNWAIRLGREPELRQSIREQLMASKNPDNLAPLWNPKALAKDLYSHFQQLLNQST
ncbi:MAG: tetratricopeptide repeat protein [Arthrospira sp. PLM2.Bin9]|nr:tetratricopeptide repeat protein [Arthrospira sp. PLM2.Bin9]TVU52650.1 MAG: tetratricopeptide repeat protein [Arthrospira sp. PLM2.Bin9]